MRVTAQGLMEALMCPGLMESWHVRPPTPLSFVSVRCAWGAAKLGTGAAETVRTRSKAEDAELRWLNVIFKT